MKNEKMASPHNLAIVIRIEKYGIPKYGWWKNQEDEKYARYHNYYRGKKIPSGKREPSTKAKTLHSTGPKNSEFYYSIPEMASRWPEFPNSIRMLFYFETQQKHTYSNQLFWEFKFFFRLLKCSEHTRVLKIEGNEVNAIEITGALKDLMHSLKRRVDSRFLIRIAHHQLF